MTSPCSEGWREETRSRLERMLTQNIMPFWYPQTLDKEKGGYYLNHDLHGNPRKGGTKMIVTQARMVWYFSKLYNTGLCGGECLQAAEHGYRFKVIFHASSLRSFHFFHHHTLELIELLDASNFYYNTPFFFVKFCHGFIMARTSSGRQKFRLTPLQVSLLLLVSSRRSRSC